MLERFKLSYDRHRWVRCTCLVVLALWTLFFFQLQNGFPPTQWRLLVQTMPQVPHLWTSQGTAMILPLSMLVMQSLSYLLIWLCIAGGWVAMVRHWRKTVREQKAFARGVQEQFEMAVQKRLEQQQHWTQPAQTTHPMHSMQATQQLPQQRAQEYTMQFRTPTGTQMPMFSTATGTRPVQQVQQGQQQQRQNIQQPRYTVPLYANPDAGRDALQPVREPVYSLPATDGLKRVPTGYADGLKRVPTGYADGLKRVPTGQEQMARRTEQTDGLTIPVQWQRKLQLRLEIGAGWDAGIKRKQQPNEDSMAALQGTCIYNNALLPFGLLVVADGMGGHAAGQEASYLTVQALLQWVVPHIAGANATSDELLAELLRDGVRQANLAVYQRGQQVGADMGTTVTAALVLDSKAYVVNVGDSRTYLYREHVGLRQITHDHSLVARLVAAGRIRADEIYTHPDRNQVYRGLGDKRDVEVDSFMVTLQAGDRLLLCSDGLWEMVRDPEIESILQHREWNPAQTSNALIQAALSGGGLDNISAIVAQATPITQGR